MPKEDLDGSFETPEKARTNSSVKENWLPGMGAGISAAIAGAALLILISQKYKMPMMSIVIAFGIAGSIRYFGKSSNIVFGVVGAILSLFATTVGNIATGMNIYCVKYPSMTQTAILTNLNFENALTLMQPVGWPMVIVCSLATGCIGFWFSIKHIKKKPPELP